MDNNDVPDNAGISGQNSGPEGLDARISAFTATLIAKGLIAGMGFDLNLYRVVADLDDRNSWKVDFLLKERYKHFNVRCVLVYVNSRTGEVEKNSYYDCNASPVMEHATRSIVSSLPGTSIGVYIDEEPSRRTGLFEISPDEWETLFWDELGATDPNYSPGWQKIFSDSIPDYPTLGKIVGGYGWSVTMSGEEVERLINECTRIAKSARNPEASGVVEKILTACEIAREKNVPLSFLGD